MRTTDYKTFKSILGNRDVDQAHVRSLVAAIEHKNLLKYFPILVNEDMDVIDGQHRLAAAMTLGVDVYYEQVPGLEIQDVMSINTHSKSWSIYDFIDAYIQLDKPDYVELKDFMTKYQLPASIAASMLHGVITNYKPNGTVTDVDGGGGVSRLIKSGAFTVRQRQHAAAAAELITALMPNADFPINRDRRFVAAITMLLNIPGFDPERMINKVVGEGLKITRRPTAKYYLLELEELYNNKIKTQGGFIELYRTALTASHRVR